MPLYGHDLDETVSPIEAGLGFAVSKDEVKTAEQQYEKMKEKVTEELKRVFRPEFINRIDSQVVFHPLAPEHIRQIVDLQLIELEKQLLLKGVSLAVPDGSIVGVLGPNGAGKSALLRAISRLNPIRGGSITFAGEDLGPLSPDAVVRRGVIQVPQGRMLFGAMSVRENLELGAYLQRDRGVVEQRLAHVLELFPVLRERSAQAAAYLSGQAELFAEESWVQVLLGQGLVARPDPVTQFVPDAELDGYLRDLAEVIADVAGKMPDHRDFLAALPRQTSHQAATLPSRVTTRLSR